jgi:hypothetical protein
MFLILACYDVGLTPVPEKEGALEETGVFELVDTSAPLECPIFQFSWESPVLPELIVVEGEVQEADGAASIAWTRLVEESGGNRVVWQIPVCSSGAFRGQGAALLGGSWIWSCMRQADGSFAVVGEVACSLDGVEIVPVVQPAPTSDGCELLAEWVLK